MNDATIHASAVRFGDDGILIRGAAGSGKSTLALDLVEEAERLGRPGLLVCDDRIILERAGGGLVARAVSHLFGLIEVRGVGIVRVPAVESVAVTLVVDLGAAPADRLPEPGRTVRLMDCDIPAFYLQQHGLRAARLVRLALEQGAGAPSERR